MARERFNNSLKILEFTRICLENECKRDWMANVVFLIQMLQLLAAVAITTFEIYD